VRNPRNAACSGSAAEESPCRANWPGRRKDSACACDRTSSSCVITRLRNRDVFINCPFDPGYRPVFDAITFAVSYLGFIPRCSLEEDDAAEIRLSKIERIIEECRFGINDLSAVTLDATTGLPRFNMPLELGLFFGCKRFGPPVRARNERWCSISISTGIARSSRISRGKTYERTAGIPRGQYERFATGFGWRRKGRRCLAARK